MCDLCQVIGLSIRFLFRINLSAVLCRFREGLPSLISGVLAIANFLTFGFEVAALVLRFSFICSHARFDIKLFKFQAEH